MKPFFSCIDVMKMYMDQSIKIFTVPERRTRYVKLKLRRHV